jgi:prevent-host-death family protein
MQTINLHQAKTHLSRLAEQAAAGEEIVIAKAGKPLARLVPYVPTARAPRRPGCSRGRSISHSPDSHPEPGRAEPKRPFPPPRGPPNDRSARPTNSTGCKTALNLLSFTR